MDSSGRHGFCYDRLNTYGAWLMGDPSILSVPTTVYHGFGQKSRLGALCNDMTLISISKSRKLVGLFGNFWEFTIQGGAPSYKLDYKP